MSISSKLHKTFVSIINKIEFKEPRFGRDFLYLSFFRERCFFVLSRAWDKEKILSPHKESNLRPSDSEKENIFVYLFAELKTYHLSYFYQQTLRFRHCCPTFVTRRKHIFLYFFTELKTYHLSNFYLHLFFYRCFESIQRKYIETGFNFPFPNENNNKFLILSCLSGS